MMDIGDDNDGERLTQFSRLLREGNEAAVRLLMTALTYAAQAMDYKFESILMSSRDTLDRKTAIQWPDEPDPDERRELLMQERDNFTRNGTPDQTEMLILDRRVRAIERVRRIIRDRFYARDGLQLSDVQRPVVDARRRSQRVAVAATQFDLIEAHYAWAVACADEIDDFQAMIGQELVKQTIESIVISHLVHPFDVILQHRNMFALGNPGTGKTEFTKVIARLFYRVGLSLENTANILLKGDFVATFEDQTPFKTTQVLYDNLGSVVFLDEAYTLIKGGQARDSGAEALGIIISFMTTFRGLLVFIMAGYEKQIKDTVIKANPGLTSRMPTRLMFEDYSADDLYRIFIQLIGCRGIELEDRELLRRSIIAIHEANLFPEENARAMNDILALALRAQLDLESRAVTEQWATQVIRRMRNRADVIGREALMQAINQWLRTKHNMALQYDPDDQGGAPLDYPELTDLQRERCRDEGALTPNAHMITETEQRRRAQQEEEVEAIPPRRRTRRRRAQ